MSQVMRYVNNAAAMWASIRPADEMAPGVLRIVSSRGTRLLLRRPLAPATAAGLLATPVTSRTLLVEDSFGTDLGPLGPGVTVTRMPVMIREAAPMAPAAGPVRRVLTPDGLATAEKVIAAGFPVPNSGPGDLLPPPVLAMPEWRIWMAYRDGAAAAAAYTYDDGTAVGVYLLATLPGHRSRGLGRSIMVSAIAAHPQRDVVLVATDAGASLYESLGFVKISPAAWYFRAAA